MKVAVIVNPNAQRMAKGYFQKIRALLKPDLIFETESISELDKTIKLVKKEMPDIVVLSGGDGTLNIGITKLIRAYKNELDNNLPIILHSRAGTMNFIADNIPVNGDPDTIFIKLKDMLQSIRSVQDIPRDNIKKTKIMKIQSDLFAEEKYSFSVVFGIPFFLIKRFYGMGKRNQKSALRMVSTAISKFVMGDRSGSELSKSVEANIFIDGKEYMFEKHICIVASPFRKLVLFFQPFYVKDDKWKDGFYFFVLSEDVWEALKNFRVLSRGLKRLKKSFNDISENVVISSRGGFALDGEIYEPNKTYTMNISLGPVVNFLKI